MGIPKAMASDDGGELKGRFKEILDAEGIQHIIMTTDLSFIDRFTRTIKHMLFERVEHTKTDWHLLFQAVIKQYNNTIHEATRLRPVDAIQDKNAVEVKTNLMLRARLKRKYKEIYIHDNGGVLKKNQKHSEMKAHVKSWSEATYKVIGIDKGALN